MFPQQRKSSRIPEHSSKGFTLIELMIVVAIIAIILTLALPVYSNYAIRAKVGEALSVAAAAKTATAATCVENRTIPALNNDLAGYTFTETPFIDTLEISGPCTEPVITITTHNTGASTDPVIVLTGNFFGGDGRITWACTTSSSYTYVPATCRS
jgi:type IV pilus assembly protein PilA